MLESTGLPSHIRPMVYADLKRVLAWRNHLDVRRHMYTKHEITLSEHQRWFERTLPNPKIHMLIFEMGHEPQGFVNFSEAENGGIADWGFYTVPGAPKGVGQHLGRAALNHAFAELKLHKVCGQALLHNERSIRFHHSLGFKQEGILRDQHYDGEQYCNVISLGLLSNEWQTNQQFKRENNDK